MSDEAKALALELSDDGFAFFVIEGDIPTECLAEFDCEAGERARRIAELVAKSDFASLSGRDCEIWLTQDQLLWRKAKLPDGTRAERFAAAASALRASTAYRAGGLAFDVGQRDLDGYTPLAAIPTERLHEAQALAKSMKLNPIRVTCSDDVEGFSTRPTFARKSPEPQHRRTAGIAAGLAVGLLLPILAYAGLELRNDAPLPVAATAIEVTPVQLPDRDADARAGPWGEARQTPRKPAVGSQIADTLPDIDLDQGQTGRTETIETGFQPGDLRMIRLTDPVIPRRSGGLDADPPAPAFIPRVRPELDLRSRSDALPYWHNPPRPQVALLGQAPILQVQAQGDEENLPEDALDQPLNPVIDLARRPAARPEGLEKPREFSQSASETPLLTRRMFRPPLRPGDARPASFAPPGLTFNANRLAQPQAPATILADTPAIPPSLPDGVPDWISPSLLLPLGVPAGHGQDSVGSKERREAATLRAARAAYAPDAQLSRPPVRRLTVLPDPEAQGLVLVQAPAAPVPPWAEEAPMRMTTPHPVPVLHNRHPQFASLGPRMDLRPKRQFPVVLVARRVSPRVITFGNDDRTRTEGARPDRGLLVRDRPGRSGRSGLLRDVPQDTQPGNASAQAGPATASDGPIARTGQPSAPLREDEIAEGDTDEGAGAADAEPLQVAALIPPVPPKRPVRRALYRRPPPDRAAFMERQGSGTMDAAISAAVAEAAEEWAADDARAGASKSDDAAEPGPPPDISPQLAALTPKPQENDAIAPAEADLPETLLRPAPPIRPDVPAQTAAPAPAEALDDGVAILSPLARPKDLKERADALRAARKAAADKVAARQVPIKTTPSERLSIPSTTRVGSAATIDDGIALGDLALIGIFGKKKSRRALIRLPQGRILKVERGGTISGWTVSAVNEDGVRLQKGGRNKVLRLAN